MDDTWSAIWPIAALSLRVSGIALVLSGAIGIPLGVLIGMKTFRGRWLAMVLLNTATGLPPVLIGLWVYLLLSRAGPLGQLGWLFTPVAMVIAQSLLATPLITTISATAVMSLDKEFSQQLMSLGMLRREIAFAMLSETRFGILVALATGFGSIISEVGAVMMVGGNIEDHTRVLTTAILLETRRGNFALALGLGNVLLVLSLMANFFILNFQRKRI